MKLNSLKLPAVVISGLYSKSLVTAASKNSLQNEKKAIKTESGEYPPDLPANEKINILGENRKNILIVVHNKEAKFLPDEDLRFLTNMLSACKLTLADVAIINLHTIHNTSYKTIFEDTVPNIVFLFGADPSALHLPVSFPHFQVQSFNTYTLLFIPALNELQNDKILKSKLWVCLQRIFSV